MKYLIYMGSFFFLFSCFMIGCSEDFDQLIETVDNIPSPTEKVFTSFDGLVLNEDEIPIEDAQVTIGDTRSSTDENGYFKIDGFFDIRGVKLVVRSQDYFDGHGTLLPLADGHIQVRILLIPKESPIVSSTDKKIDIVGLGYILEFQEDSFVDDLNNPYEGEVQIYTSYLQPTDADYSLKHPGDLLVEDAEDNQMILPYGILNVEIYGSSGQQLNIMKPVNVEFQIPDALISEAEDEMPLWLLNTETSKWVEEGVVSREGDKMKGSIEHFSSWCFGVNFRFVILSGTVGRNGLPYSNADVGIAHYELSRRKASVDENGNYATSVIANKNYSLTVLDRCKNELFRESNRTQSDDLTYDIETDEPFNELIIMGNVTCESEVSENSYVLVDFQGNGYTGVAQTDESGRYEYAVDDCGFEDIVIRAYDVSSSTKSQALNIQESGNYNIDVCAEPFNGEIIFEIDGEPEPYVITNCKVTIETMVTEPIVLLPGTTKFFFEATDYFESIGDLEGESAKYEITVFNRTEPPMAPFGPVNRTMLSEGAPFMYLFAPSPFVINLDEEGIVEITFSNPAFFVKLEGEVGTIVTGTVRIRAVVQE